MGSTVADVACSGKSGWRCRRSRVAVWEACMVPPLGVRTMMRLCGGPLLCHGVSVQIKCPVQPESAQPNLGLVFVCSLVDRNKFRFK